MGVKLGLQTLNEEHILRVSENRVLRRIFVLKRNKIIEGWRKVYNEDLITYNLRQL
jgi:hypothetical protein